MTLGHYVFTGSWCLAPRAEQASSTSERGKGVDGTGARSLNSLCHVLLVLDLNVCGFLMSAMSNAVDLLESSWTSTGRKRTHSHTQSQGPMQKRAEPDNVHRTEEVSQEIKHIDQANGLYDSA